nr:hypothetical protein [Granulicella sp. S156]
MNFSGAIRNAIPFWVAVLGREIEPSDRKPEKQQNHPDKNGPEWLQSGKVAAGVRTSR